MSYQVSGRLVRKFDTESKTASFQTREFVIVTAEQYPQYVKFQLVQDRAGIIDGFDDNAEITVHFDLRGREWQGKYFTNLQAWKVEGATAGARPAAGEDLVGDAPAPDNIADVDPDDLPF